MKMHRTLLVYILTCLITVIWGYQNVHKYPDPYAPDLASRKDCGRNNRSNVCDPDDIISRQQADDIDNLIWSVYRETRCPCPVCTQRGLGYVIRVALMSRMESIHKLGNTSEDKLKDAEMFSYILGQKWKDVTGVCNASVIILYSRYDNTLYTLTFPQARSVLTDEAVKSITMNVRPLFDDKDKVAEGLKEMIRRYKLVFDGDPNQALRPRISEQRGSTASDTPTSFFVSLFISGLLIAMIH